MKNNKVLFILVSGIFISGCGLSDPWEKWADEGTLPEDRMLPSDVLATLCSVEWWKFEYSEETFYFQFYDDGTAITNSTIHRDELTTSFWLDWDDAYSVELNISGGGHLQYLSSGGETAFLISAYSTSSITSTGVETAASFVFVPTDSEEVEDMAEDKAEEVAKVEAVQRIIDAGFDHGAVFCSDDLLAHYYMNIAVEEEENYTIRFDILKDGEVAHTTIAISVDINSTVTFTESVTIGDYEVTGMSYSDYAMTLTGSTGYTVAENTTYASWYIGSSYSTYILSDGCEAIMDEFQNYKDYWGQIEFSDRDGRPIFYGSPNWDAHATWYVGVYSNNTPTTDSTQQDIAYFTGGYYMEMPYGGYESNMDDVATFYDSLLSFYFNTDGVIVAKHPSSEILWLLSPTGTSWIKGTR